MSDLPDSVSHGDPDAPWNQEDMEMAQFYVTVRGDIKIEAGVGDCQEELLREAFARISDYVDLEIVEWERA